MRVQKCSMDLSSSLLEQNRFQASISMVNLGTSAQGSAGLASLAGSGVAAGLAFSFFSCFLGCSFFSLGFLSLFPALPETSANFLASNCASLTQRVTSPTTDFT